MADPSRVPSWDEILVMARDFVEDKKNVPMSRASVLNQLLKLEGMAAPKVDPEESKQFLEILHTLQEKKAV